MNQSTDPSAEFCSKVASAAHNWQPDSFEPLFNRDLNVHILASQEKGEIFSLI